MIQITDLLDEKFLDLLMVTMSFLGLFLLLASIYSLFGANEYKDYQIIVDIMVSILLIVFGSIYTNFILFRSLNQVACYL